MNFLRAYLKAIGLLALMASIVVIVLYTALAFHIIGPHDYVGAAVIGYLLGIVMALLLLPFIWWYLVISG